MPTKDKDDGSGGGRQPDEDTAVSATIAVNEAPSPSPSLLALDGHRLPDEDATKTAALCTTAMFQISDPITNAVIALDDIFDDLYYMDVATEINGNGDGRQSDQSVTADTSFAAGELHHEMVELHDAGEALALPCGEDALVSTATDSAAMMKKRLKNRDHATRSRLRKKFLLERSQDQIRLLEEQLERLKKVLHDHVSPDEARRIIQTACGDQKTCIPVPTPSGFGPVKALIEPDFHRLAILCDTFAISDPRLPDNPIVFVSQGFLDLTGYKREETLGRNCRFLQGPNTDQSAVNAIRKGIGDGVDTSVCLLNYRADGSTFWNQFFVAPLRDSSGNVVDYVGVQCEVSQDIVDKHRTKPPPPKV